VVSIITEYSVTRRNTTHRPHRTCGLAEKHHTVLIACGTSAARCWLPQALALLTFIRDVLVELKTLAVRCVTEYVMMETAHNTSSCVV